MAHLLLVEDDAAIRTALTRALREYGHVITTVGSGMPALTTAVEHKPAGRRLTRSGATRRRRCRRFVDASCGQPCAGDHRHRS